LDIDRFFTEHWQDIEEERIARYEQMFVWRDAQTQLLIPAEIGPGHHVLDIGAGPGFFALGISSLVGTAGEVHGVDINERFVRDANVRAKDQPNVTFHHVSNHELPFPDASFDRVICKNVLEYVPDLHASLTEVSRVLRPGGKVHVIDSDWGFVVVEPWGRETVARFFQAAAPAFNEPCIGRKAPAKLAASGFLDIQVQLLGHVDRQGASLNVLRNMGSYIKTFSTLPTAEVDSLLQDAEDAIAENRFLFCLPQFLITATR
jgi:ubiquinone/menaquinone biosynthesis C-methylase UbiE